LLLASRGSSLGRGSVVHGGVVVVNVHVLLVGVFVVAEGGCLVVVVVEGKVNGG
jgi:hypothetical protein